VRALRTQGAHESPRTYCSERRRSRIAKQPTEFYTSTHAFTVPRVRKKTIFITSSFAGARLFKTALPAVISYVSVPVQSLQVGGVGVGSHWCPKNDPIGIVAAYGSN